MSYQIYILIITKKRALGEIEKFLYQLKLSNLLYHKIFRVGPTCFLWAMIEPTSIKKN